MPGKDKVTRYMRAFLGPNDLSGDARIFSNLMNQIEEAENTGWNDEYHRYISSAQRTMAVEGFQAILNDTALRSFPLLTTQSESEFAILFGSGAEPIIGDAAYMIPALQIMDASSFDGGIAVLDGTFRADAAQYSADQYNPLGRVLHPNTQEAATIDGASHDWGVDHAPSLLGGWGLLLVTAAGGTWSLKIQDSSDDAAFADLITFAADGSTIVGEALSVAGSVDQFTRIQYTRTSGVLDAVCLFARNF